MLLYHNSFGAPQTVPTEDSDLNAYMSWGSGSSTDQPFPVSAPPWSLRHNHVQMRPVNNPAVASRFSSERESLMSVTLNQNLEMTKLRGGGGTRKAERGRKPGLLCHTVSQAVHAKKKKKS